MKDLIAAVSLLLTIFGFLYTTTPDDAFSRLAPWQPWITGAGILVFCAVSAWLGVRWAQHRNARAERVAAFIIITKTVRDKLVSWGKLDAADLDKKLERLEQSEDAVWIDDDARAARDAFIGRARHALDVRRTREDYRNELERSDHHEHLNNYADRLVAALLKRKMPELFNPYDDYDDRSLWQRVKGAKRRFLRRFRRDEPGAA